MDALKVFLDQCRKTGTTSLRRVFPGRGRNPRETRAAVRVSFEKTGEVDGVVFDRRTGLFTVATSESA